MEKQNNIHETICIIKQTENMHILNLFLSMFDLPVASI